MPFEDEVKTKAELSRKWEGRLMAADRVYQAWRNRFKCEVMYQYYEGFQHLIEQDQNNLPYVVNLIYANIEEKLPNMLFDSPSFVLRPHPYGDNDTDDSMKMTGVKEDALNFVCGRPEYGLNDKHELAVLDAFFGFGVLETDYSSKRQFNPSLNKSKNDPLDNLYCKQIPFDHFRVSALANWDLSQGKWYGYFNSYLTNR